MAKNDFDIDFDFEEEYGFDPKAFLGTEEYDGSIDLTEFSDEELGLKEPKEEAPEEPVPEAEEFPAEEADDEELPYDPLEGFPRETYDEEPLETEEDVPIEPQEETDYPEEPPYDEEEPEDEEVEKPRKKKKVHKDKVKKEFHTPRFIEKFYDLYFAPLSNKSMLDEPQDPNNPRRRRRKSRSQIFKEVYLPPILVCLCAVLVLSFIMGSASNAISKYKLEHPKEPGEKETSSNAAQLADQAYRKALDEADALATEYDYDKAIEVLNKFKADPGYSAADHPDIATKTVEYANIKNSLVEHSDPNQIPNLSFHVLINDMARAKADPDYGGSYNRNFVTTQEFGKILNQLYNNGYVLVDFDSFVGATSSVDGNDMFSKVPVLLPEGKKPVMLTETMVNYFHYMISGTAGGDADASGDSFASKLVLKNGEIKAEYVDATGATLVGDYDFVPILETFIKSHPDFVYRGARATLAVTGYEGVFGYRTNTEYSGKRGEAYYNEQVTKAKEIAQALRDRGYRIACYTYGNINYKKATADQIQKDVTDWTNQIAVPVLGTVDTLVFAKEGNISDYEGTVFKMLYNAGFRYFVSNSDKPSCEVNSTFVKQNRLMVTGNALAWKRDRFEGIFDCAAVLDAQTRGDVPNG